MISMASMHMHACMRGSVAGPVAATVTAVQIERESIHPRIVQMHIYTFMNSMYMYLKIIIIEATCTACHAVQDRGQSSVKC